MWNHCQRKRPHSLVMHRETSWCVPAVISSVELLRKLSSPVFRSKWLMHFQTLLNIYKFADSTTFRFVLLSVIFCSSSQGGLHTDPSCSCEQPSKCVCVPLVVTGILLNCSVFSRGAGCSCKYQPNEEACIDIGGDAHRRTCFL